RYSRSCRSAVLRSRERTPEVSSMPMRVSDLCSLPKLGLKGPAAEGWLRERGIDVPAATYEVSRLSDGGLIARLGAADFFLEGGQGSELLPRLAAELAANPPRVYRVERHDACYLLSGAETLRALAQICGFDFRLATPNRVVLTRAAGINCMVLPA